MTGLRVALTMFTVAPVRGAAVDRAACAAALRWLVALGAVLGAAGAAVAMVAWRGGSAGSPLLGAVLAVGTPALLTRGLHVDGLADVADALGSRRPPDEALVIMKQPDIGPFGVAAVLGVALVQVASVTTVLGAGDRPAAVVVLAAAAATGRFAALDAARPAVPSARPGGFGDLVAGTASAGWRMPVMAGLLTATVGLSYAAGMCGLCIGGAVLAGLVVARLACAHLVRRFGGVTGDVFGALIELATTVVLLASAVVVVWRGAP